MRGLKTEKALLIWHFCSEIPIGIIKKTKYIKLLLGLQWLPGKYVTHLSYGKTDGNGLGFSHFPQGCCDFVLASAHYGS